MIPVILDTDLGGDIDDHWALVMLLGCPELDLRLVTTVTGDPTYRAQVTSGILKTAGRSDVPIGVGLAGRHQSGKPLGSNASRNPLGAYPGVVFEDGVDALVEAVVSSPEPVTIIATGGWTNLAAALDREPGIADNARVVAMFGSVREGYEPDSAPTQEANVGFDIPAAQKVLAAQWEVLIAPLDSCASVVLDGERYAAVRNAHTPLTDALFDAYLEWCGQVPGLLLASSTDEEQEKLRHELTERFETTSTILYDTVPVHLAYSTALAVVERLPIAVDDDGMTRIREGAREVQVATGWVDKDAFLDHLVERLTSDRQAPA
jgi:inosine-uridine nucleoside N-ribohydrolase